MLVETLGLPCKRLQSVGLTAQDKEPRHPITFRTRPSGAEVEEAIDDYQQLVKQAFQTY